MIMRADGAMRVMLNSPVFEGMNYGDSKNKPPTNKQILLASTENGRTVPLLLRVSQQPDYRSYAPRPLTPSHRPPVNLMRRICTRLFGGY